MPGIGHIVLNVSVTYCNCIENKPRAPVPAGRELWQKSHNFQQTDRLERFSVDVNRNSKGVPKGAQIRFGLL
jgi:hypothetical protein